MEELYLVATKDIATHYCLLEHTHTVPAGRFGTQVIGSNEYRYNLPLP